MTPKERSEEIARMTRQVRFKSAEVLRKAIEMQIKEAEREAYQLGFKELQGHRMESNRQAYDRGWNAAIEKAAKICENEFKDSKQAEFRESHSAAVYLADEIRALKQEGK